MKSSSSPAFPWPVASRVPLSLYVLSRREPQSLTAEPGLGGAEQGHSEHGMVRLLGIAHTLALAVSSNGYVTPLE